MFEPLTEHEEKLLRDGFMGHDYVHVTFQRLIATLDAERERSEARATMAVQLANDVQQAQKVYVRLSERLLAAERICRYVWDSGFADDHGDTFRSFYDDWIEKGGY